MGLARKLRLGRLGQQQGRKGACGGNFDDNGRHARTSGARQDHLAPGRVFWAAFAAVEVEVALVGCGRRHSRALDCEQMCVLVDE